MGKTNVYNHVSLTVISQTLALISNFFYGKKKYIF